eukprot:COSAG02_NODE_486_length_21363_cov_22.137509_9_plen_259_part_00
MAGPTPTVVSWARHLWSSHSDRVVSLHRRAPLPAPARLGLHATAALTLLFLLLGLASAYQRRLLLHLHLHLIPVRTRVHLSTHARNTRTPIVRCPAPSAAHLRDGTPMKLDRSSGGSLAERASALHPHHWTPNLHLNKESTGGVVLRSSAPFHHTARTTYPAATCSIGRRSNPRGGAHRQPTWWAQEPSLAAHPDLVMQRITNLGDCRGRRLPPGSSRWSAARVDPSLPSLRRHITVRETAPPIRTQTSPVVVVGVAG